MNNGNKQEHEQIQPNNGEIQIVTSLVNSNVQIPLIQLNSQWCHQE
jgi:hypothetical protein